MWINGRTLLLLTADGKRTSLGGKWWWSEKRASAVHPEGLFSFGWRGIFFSFLLKRKIRKKINTTARHVPITMRESHAPTRPLEDAEPYFFFLLLFLFSAIKRLLQQRIKDEVATPQPAASLARLLRQHPIRLWTCCEMAHIRTTTTIRQRERSKEKKSGNGSWNKTIYKKLRRLFTLAEKVKCQMRRRVEARASGAQMFSLFRHSRWLKSYGPLCAARRASTETSTSVKMFARFLP